MGDTDSAAIDAYIRGFPEPTRKLLEELRAEIRRTVPEATERISYKMPAFYHRGDLAYYAAYEGHIGFYPTPSGIEAFKGEIARFKHSKGAVRFPLDEPLPLDLIRRIVLFRFNENERRAPK